MKLPKAKMKVNILSKKIVWILCIVLPLIGFYLGTKLNTSSIHVYQSNTKTQATPSQALATYESPDYNFQIKYPANFIISDVPITEGALFDQKDFVLLFRVLGQVNK